VPRQATRRQPRADTTHALKVMQIKHHGDKKAPKSITKALFFKKNV
jgi:hypothetical protein